MEILVNSQFPESGNILVKHYLVDCYRRVKLRKLFNNIKVWKKVKNDICKLQVQHADVRCLLCLANALREIVKRN